MQIWRPRCYLSDLDSFPSSLERTHPAMLGGYSPTTATALKRAEKAGIAKNRFSRAVPALNRRRSLPLVSCSCYCPGSFPFIFIY
jgi:hypothetical protein